MKSTIFTIENTSKNGDKSMETVVIDNTNGATDEEIIDFFKNQKRYLTKNETFKVIKKEEKQLEIRKYTNYITGFRSFCLSVEFVGDIPYVERWKSNRPDTPKAEYTVLSVEEANQILETDPCGLDYDVRLNRHLRFQLYNF